MSEDGGKVQEKAGGRPLEASLRADVDDVYGEPD
jgi:hypothetical protein